MNKKGQVLVLFVMIFPIIFLAFYVVLSKVYLYGEKNKQEKLIDTLCNYYKQENDLDKIIELSTKNDDKQEIKIKRINDSIEITLIKSEDNILNFLSKNKKIKSTTICE